MGRLMGSSNSNNYGEQIFINKASEYLDDTNIIYWNRQLFGKEFDVCILMPEKGINAFPACPSATSVILREQI